jgi:predicted lipid-binding transport protein (Tim44 family)
MRRGVKNIARIVLGLAAALAVAASAYARGGGGCLEEGTLVQTEQGLAPIERLTVGQVLPALTERGLTRATVQALIQVQPRQYIEILADGRSIRATPEHPFMVAPGVFRQAGSLRAGENVYLCDGRQTTAVPITSIRALPATRPAYNLLVSPGGTYLAAGFVVHNKGCFLPDTPILRADGTQAAIADIRAGDDLLAFTAQGRIVTARVENVITHPVQEYVLVRTERVEIKVTPEHPFYVGEGTFKTLQALHVGDSVYAYDGAGLSPQRIVSMSRVLAPTTVYNLQTSEPHTFFAMGIAVHNKGGGGGCFPSGTRIATPAGWRAIETLGPGDVVQAVTPEGTLTHATVHEMFRTLSPILELRLEGVTLRTTAEHPVAVGGDQFVQAGLLEPGQHVLALREGKIDSVPILEVRRIEGTAEVFNLTVDSPHTFVAEGVIVHNKGGGFGGGFHGGGSGGSADPSCVISFFVIFVIIITISIAQKRKAQNVFRGKMGENLDYTFTASDVMGKAGKTQKLLDFLSRQDATMTPQALRDAATSTFLKLQECWTARDYTPMKPLMMTDLYMEHCSQLEGMKRDHEIDKIDQLSVQRVDLVNVRYTEKSDNREFTALISAKAMDYYVDDRDGHRLRGDESPQPFQEFWTFQRQGQAWLLREVEQTRESSALKHENFVEMFTDNQLQNIYADKAGQEGAAGPWVEKPVDQKESKIDRMLNFLVQSDKMWDRQVMVERARSLFLGLHLAIESGDASPVADDLFPDLAKAFAGELADRKAKGIVIEYRNLCVRKADLLLVRNFTDRNQDEYVVRITAHAQKVVRRGETVLREDPYVSPFEEFWTMGRLDGKWKLKEILPPDAGKQAESQENIDQNSSQGQLEWYYKQSRAN